MVPKTAFSKYIPLCSAEERNSYRFPTTWGWENYNRIFIFGWSISLRTKMVGYLNNPKITLVCVKQIYRGFCSVRYIDKSETNSIIYILQRTVKQ